VCREAGIHVLPVLLYLNATFLKIQRSTQKPLMFKLFLITTSLVLTSMVFGQKMNRLELECHGRYDKHADYTTRFFDRSYTNDTKLSGKSFGFNINYLHQVYKYFDAKIGIGYFNLGIDKIRQTTPYNIIANGRTINYHHPSGIYPLFGTKKYHYDNFNITFGFAYKKPTIKALNLIIGADLYYLYTFSQFYRISYDNIRYRTNNGKTLGFGATTYFGFLHNFNSDKYYISPKLVVPIYQQLRGDQVFGEAEGLKMQKWLNGVGLSVSIGKYF
jgi:hypothetical protein